VLIALHHVARHRETFLENHALKALRTVERGRTQAPYAFVIPRAQRHAAEAADLVNYFRRMGTEVHAASADFAARTMAPVIERPALPPAGAAGAGAAAAPTRADSARADSSGPNATGAAPAANALAVRAGDWIVRLDQPYTGLARTVLARQRYRADDPPPYDDTAGRSTRSRHVTVHTSPTRRCSPADDAPHRRRTRGRHGGGRRAACCSSRRSATGARRRCPGTSGARR
jgi:hypothetical protein